MRKIFTLFILSAFLLIPNVGKAVTSVTVGENCTTYNTNYWLTYVVPFYTKSSYSSMSQQIYTAADLKSTAAPITKLTFYVEGSNQGAATSCGTRHLQVYMMETAKDSFVIDDSNRRFALQYNSSYQGGSLVFDGEITPPSVAANEQKTYDIELEDPFDYNGTANLLLTIIDLTAETRISSANLRHVIIGTDRSRYLHHVEENSSGEKAWFTDLYKVNYPSYSGKSDLYNATAGGSNDNKNYQVRQHRYVNKVTFTFDDGEAPPPPATPDDLAVSATTTTSATLSWSAVSGATSYDFQQSANGSDWIDLASGATGTSYNWTGLSAASTQYARIRATNTAGSSDWSDAVIVTTDAVHEHNGITFNKWTSTNSLPSSGNYYLDANVELGYVGPDLTLSGDLNLCLNGKTANLGIYKIIVPDEKTLTIYDNVGGGKITSIVPGQIEAFEVNYQAVIVVRGGGTLVLKEGVIENNYEHNPEDPSDEYYSYAICSNGAIHLSGDVLINSNDIDIYLHESKVITLDGALSNVDKHTVYITGGAFTSGWSTYMSGEDPRNYFESANSARSVFFNGSEAAMRLLLHLSEASLNSSIGTSSGQVADINLTRSVLTSASYNTICLPFALSDAQLEEYFGAGYDLEEFVSSSLDGEALNLTFNKVTSLTAGKPYLLQPSIDIVNPSFEGVTISATSPADQEDDTYISFHGTYAPTELAGGNRNLLFLGADNELFWPESTGNIKGFRAYFEVKPSAGAAKRARIVKKEEGATGIENQKAEIKNQKFLKDGQLLIRRDNKTYNVIGQMVK